MSTPFDGGSLRRAQALRLIESQPAEGTLGVPSLLGRLCRAVAEDLHLAGATVTLIPQVGAHLVAGSSSTAITRTEELQFDTGQGPTRDAYDTGRPVIVVDLEGCYARWPGYVPAALEAGVCAVFALPLQVGAARLGALTLYWPQPQRPATRELRAAMVFADLATEVLIDGSFVAESVQVDQHLQGALDTQGHIYQAQGMVMVDLGVGLSEALARIRAHAYATGQEVATLARDIVDGTTTLTKDPLVDAHDPEKDA